MTRAIKFTKMHGAGNDYIYVDTTQYPISHPEELARAWSAPHTGIGSDGLVLIGSSDKADFIQCRRLGSPDVRQRKQLHRKISF